MNGIRQISGRLFGMENGIWTSYLPGGLKMTLTRDDTRGKCCLYDAKDKSKFYFDTVTAAKVFARRKRHGRTLEEHQLAETLQTAREKMGWSVKDAGEKLGVSPRTIESWLSGARPVPQIVRIALMGCI